MSKVIYEENNHIGYVTFNRPESLNCFDFETLNQLQEIVDSLHINNEVRVVIFTGAGEKAFSAGADLKERKTLNQTEVKRNVKAIRDVFSAIAALPQPTIAAINGYALGGGLELALACDFRYAVQSATLGLTEVSWAIIPGAGGTQRLTRLIGTSKAMELILTAKKFDAEEALQLGVVNGVAERSELFSICEKLAYAITANGPIAVQQAKYAILHGSEVSLQSGLAIEQKAYEVIIPTKDRIEALEAFAEKRKPNFKGK
ncbi:enoyl-CoA hydratase-related protein [Alkalihalobacillus pseudalcaliphilus]|uniref:enoyl-CoA hydratase-related protein n=1 Tax=Alkalihalobacillus pseudalcaliphilus TaxID=79884 RepID=UPI00064DBA39|nr:enoyl-CoA hydratase-related protein [Alkalihalobacillus pseudalcaliphilus]KMK76881.1 enoyl-CoA hydratase [Alkalihalobacillus pseudalcaliphilus]